MRKEVKKQQVLRFMADFETLTGKDVIDETYVWASGICSIDNPYNEEYLKIWNNDEDYINSYLNFLYVNVSFII